MSPIPEQAHFSQAVLGFGLLLAHSGSGHFIHLADPEFS